MNTLAQRVPAMPRWRLFDWAAQAWRQLSWRYVLLAFGLQFVRATLGPLGGIFFLAGDPGNGWQPFTQFLDGSWLVGGMLIVFCVLVADKAYDDGVSPFRAYAIAVLAFSTLVPVLDWLCSGHFGWLEQPAPSIVWWAQVLLFQGGLGTSIYAYWRVTQRAMRQAQAAEAERLRNEQRVQTARLLALQARVEPQMLFDALGRVAALHVDEPQAADALLADLIALLRAMQPRQTTDISTVEREFALVEAWLRVTHSVAPRPPRVRLRISGCHPVGIAPMLVLPLLRAALAGPRAAELQWVLSAEASGARLTVTLQSTPDMDTAGLSASQELASLQERLSRLFGRSAGLSVLPHLSSLTLDLPRLQEESDDDRPDR